MAEKQANISTDSLKPQSESTVFYDHKNSKRLVCKHYRRGCKIWAPCCKDGAFYACRICHDKKENHTVDRFNIGKLQCANCCFVLNKITRECPHCQESFGKYACLKCRLFDDNVSKQHYHCDKCGVCREGGQKNYFHCETCGYCMNNDVKDTHKCIPNVSRNDCPICLDDLHSSSEGMSTLRCGHILHPNCLKSMTDRGLQRCPTCNASISNTEERWRQLAEEVEAWPMPLSHQNFFVEVLCNDCHKVTKVKYHTIALKCGECPSFNTRRTGQESSPEEDMELSLEIGTVVDVIQNQQLVPQQLQQIIQQLQLYMQQIQQEDQITIQQLLLQEELDGLQGRIQDLAQGDAQQGGHV